MYHVVICDDDKGFIGYMREILLKARDNKKQGFKIYEYFSGNDLIYHLDGMAQCDLLILDMQMNGMDGDETAACFRKRFPEVVLVFCSGVRLPTVKSFKTTPFRYLLKKWEEPKMINEMKEALAEVERTFHIPYIIGHYRNKLIKVKISDILYFENAKRGSRVVVSPESKEAGFDEQILVDEKPKKLAERFAGLRFAVPHNSYLVNLEHVDMIQGNQIKLNNGEILSLSRAYGQEFRKAFAKWSANKY